jgi:hypothetical protein
MSSVSPGGDADVEAWALGVEVGARLFHGVLSWRKLSLASGGVCAW